MKSKLLGAVVGGAFMLCAASAAKAVPMLSFDGGGDVVGVTGLVVGGMTYDATWSQGSFNAVGQNPTLLSSQADATTLVNQIFSLFNTNGITSADVGGGLSCAGSGDCDLVVAYNVNAVNFDAVNVDWDTSPADWDAQVQTWARTFVSPLVAQVTLTKVPEPGTLAVFALGLAGLGFARRRRTA